MNDFYEVNDKPVWDANLGRWIEPDEVLDSEDIRAESPNQSTETDGACRHNTMVLNDQTTDFAWKCADCGYIYGANQ